MINRLVYLLISVCVLIGITAGFLLAPGSALSLAGFGLLGGAAASLLLSGICRALPLAHNWHTTALRLGLPFSFFAVLLFFWAVPMVRFGLSVNAEPLQMSVDDLAASAVAAPRYVSITGTFDEALAVQKSYQVQTRSSNKSSYQTETRHYCRSPLLSGSKTIDLMTDQCAPYTVRPSRYTQRLSGMLYPACRDGDKACREWWPEFTKIDPALLANAGYYLHEDKGYFLRTGVSPKRTYLSPLIFVGLALLIWLALVMTLAVFGRPPEHRIAARTAPAPRRHAEQAAPPKQAAPAAEPEPDAGVTYAPTGPEQRLEEALRHNASERESLDLTAYWESYMAERPLRQLPSGIGAFTNLKSLGLLWNQLDDLPAEIARLTRLEELVLHCNPLGRLPDPLRHLHNLRLLDIERCSLQELPDWIGNLEQLETLKAPDNQLQTLPDGICRLSGLKILNLRENRLEALPDCRSALPNLTRLDLSQNRLSRFPEMILQMANLQELDLSENLLTALSDAADARCQALETLLLQGNALTAWPAWLARLTRLKELHFGPTAHVVRNENRLTTVPDTVANLIQLQTLSLSLARDAVVSDALGELRQLTELRLWAFRLPPAVTSLDRLKSLYLIGLWDEEQPLPGQWGRLAGLEALDIDIKSAALIPDELCAARRLKTFTVRCDKINDYQKDRLRRLKPAGCRIDIKLARSDRTIVL